MDMKLSPEQLKLRSAARELAETEFAPKAAEIDRTEAYPFDNVAAGPEGVARSIRMSRGCPNRAISNEGRTAMCSLPRAPRVA